MVTCSARVRRGGARELRLDETLFNRQRVDVALRAISEGEPITMRDFTDATKHHPKIARQLLDHLTTHHVAAVTRKGRSIQIRLTSTGRGVLEHLNAIQRLTQPRSRKIARGLGVPLLLRPRSDAVLRALGEVEPLTMRAFTEISRHHPTVARDLLAHLVEHRVVVSVKKTDHGPIGQLEIRPTANGREVIRRLLAIHKLVNTAMERSRSS